MDVQTDHNYRIASLLRNGNILNLILDIKVSLKFKKVTLEFPQILKNKESNGLYICI